MNDRIIFFSKQDISLVTKALSSPIRQQILQLLYNRKMNILQIAEALKIHQSTCTQNIQILEKAGLVKSEMSAGEKRGAQKICTTSIEEVVISIQNENVQNDKVIETDMPIGLFNACDIHPPCGLVSETELIGYFDHPETFMEPHRATAQLIWFSHGFLEYGFPNKLPKGAKIKEICIKAEICSEYPGANENWPSDITVWMNGKEVGTWTSPGDMADKRGRLTPSWWLSEDSQYGFLKSWRITKEGSFTDGNRCSDITLDDLDIENHRHYVVKIGIKNNATNRGGLNLFGSNFGNYDQNIKLITYLDE